MVAGEQFLPENIAREHAEYLKKKNVELEAEVESLRKQLAEVRAEAQAEIDEQIRFYEGRG